MQGWLNDESYLETVFFTNFPHTSPISSISHVCHHLWKAGINKGLLTLRTVIQQTMLRSMFPQGIIFAMIINIAVTSLESKSARLHQGHTRRHQPSGLSATYEAHHHSRLPSGHMFTQQQALLYFAGIESRSTYCNGRQTITLTKICFCPQTKLKKIHSILETNIIRLWISDFCNNFVFKSEWKTYLKVMSSWG